MYDRHVLLPWIFWTKAAKPMPNRNAGFDILGHKSNFSIYYLYPSEQVCIVSDKQPFVFIFTFFFFLQRGFQLLQHSRSICICLSAQRLIWERSLAQDRGRGEGGGE